MVGILRLETLEQLSALRRGEVREMLLGRFAIVRLGGLTLGLATYQPGWKWSVHVGSTVGAPRCTVEHVGLVVSGTATAAFDDGTVVELRPGALFHIPARPHASWVVGDEPYVSLHFPGADHYARERGAANDEASATGVT
jgi:hypothetical protein